MPVTGVRRGDAVPHPGGRLRTLWRRPLHQRGAASAVAVAPGHLVVHERATRLVDLDPVDGVVRWDVPVGTWPRALVVDGAQCWIIRQDRDELRCLDLDSGRLIWSAGLSPTTAQVAVVGDVVLVGGWRGYTGLRAFDRWDGTPRWAGAERVHTVQPVGSGWRVLTGRPGGTTVRSLDVRDGVEVAHWTLAEPIAPFDGDPAFTAVGEDRFLIRCGAHSVWQIRPGAGEVGEFFRHDRALAVAPTYPIGSVVWVRETGGGFVAVDAVTGRPRWRSDVGRATVDGVVPAGPGYVFGARRAGTLFLVDAAGNVVDRASVEQVVASVRRLGADTLLVVGKGTVAAVGVSTPD